MGAHTQKEQLTLLITELFDWIELKGDISLQYKDISLRGAFERYLYFDSLANPANLRPLLLISKDWRSQNPTHQLIQTYDYYWTCYKSANLKNKIKMQVLPLLKIISDYYRQYKARKNHYKVKSSAAQPNCIGFFVIEKRFIHFFAEIHAGLNKEEKRYFSQLPIIDKKSQTESVMAQPFSLSLTAFELRLSHPLFYIYYRLCFFYEKIYASLTVESPKTLLFAEGTSHYEYLAAQAAKVLNIPTIRLQSGRAAVLHSGYRQMPFDVMICWGKGFVDHYQRVSPDNKYVICGNPDIKPLTISSDGKKNKLVIFTQPKNKGWIIEDDYAELISVAMHFLTQTDIQVLVRMHPVDDDEFFITLAKTNPQLKIVNSPQYSMASVLSEASCVISYASTTISEAAASGVIPIILKKPSQPKLYPFPEDVGAALVVEKTTDAIQLIMSIIEQPEYFAKTYHKMKNFSELYFNTHETDSVIDKMISVIRTISLADEPLCRQ